METKELSILELKTLQKDLDEIYQILGLHPKVSTRVKAKGKKELADLAGVDIRTFVSWISAEPHKSVLAEMGITKDTRIFHPRAVSYLYEEFDLYPE